MNTLVPQSAISTRFPMPAGIDDFDARKWRVLCETTFPSARTPEAIMMALDYCRARGLDVFKRPVNIVPMWNSSLKREVETVWPGINEIQTTAARTRQWAGMDEPKWGEEVTSTFQGRAKGKDGWEERTVEVTYPKWCSVTVYRMIEGQRCAFTEPVYWLEAYSRMGGGELPTGMWVKRPRGQLHKVAKAASLRAAFPEEGEYTAEEMEGKEIESGGVVIEHQPAAPAPKRTREQISAEAARKRQDLRDCEADINQMESLYALEKYEREVLTPEFMAALGMKSYALANTLENRRRELQAQEPQAEEAHDPDTGELPAFDKAEYIRNAYNIIAEAQDEKALLDWFNDKGQRTIRAKELTTEEREDLRLRVVDRRERIAAPRDVKLMSPLEAG